jgi:hypothetical protein
MILNCDPDLVFLFVYPEMPRRHAIYLTICTIRSIFSSPIRHDWRCKQKAVNIGSSRLKRDLDGD